MTLHLLSFAASPEGVCVGVSLSIPGAPGLSPRLLRSIRLANVAQLPVRLLGSDSNHIGIRFLTSFCQIIMEFDARGISRSGLLACAGAMSGPRAGSEILAVWHRHRGSSARSCFPDSAMCGSLIAGGLRSASILC